MNTLKLLCIYVGTLALISSSNATLLLDEFSSGEFSLAHGETTSDSAAFATPLTDQRVVSAIGFPDWTATLVAGELVYEVNQIDLAAGRNYLDLNYSVSGATFSILGYSAFSIHVNNVVGMGDFVASVSGSGGGDVRIPIVASGTIVSPFSNLDTNLSLDSLSQMNFRFRAFSQDFSVTIDDVSLIPEPLSGVLLLVGAGALWARRQFGH